MRVWNILLICVTLAGCAKIDSWKGHHVDELIQAWGPPTETQAMSGGRRVLIYANSHMVSGTSLDCRVWFFVGADGTIQSGSGEGTLGGCNRLLGYKPAWGEKP